MNSNTKLPQNKFYLILTLCAIIIFLNSIEVMMNVKDIELYDQWVSEIEESSDFDNEDYYDSYVTSNLNYFFIKIIMPMALGIYSYFAFKYTRINKIYVYVWTILLLASFVFALLELEFDSMFYYINMFSYIILIGTLLSLTNIINDR